MIISKIPLRISFMGGGSDLPSFYKHESGCVVSTAIDKYIYITVNSKFDNRIRASYSITEIVDDITELKHDLIRESLRLVDIRNGIEITSISDIPSDGSGMGSSSSYTVGLLNALYAHKGIHIPPKRLASEACHVEINMCKKPIGKQDQYIAAYGGLNKIEFYKNEDVVVNPIICNQNTKDNLQQRLLLFYTGTTRSANGILRQQQTNIENDPIIRNTMRSMVRMAHTMCESLQKNDLSCFGQMLHESWLMKKSLAPTISNDIIDDYYALARKSGAQGGKILGAGGGGFFLIYAEPEQHPAITKSLAALRHIPFRFESQGSRVIYSE